MNISWTDGLVLLGYMLAMVAFGVWMGRGAKTSADFMVGGRNLPWYAVLFSIVATETSTITFLSVPGLGYASNLTFLQLPLGYIVGRLLVVTILLPRFFTGNMVTAYEVLDARFGGSIKQVASLLFIVMRTLGDGIRLFLGAIALSAVTDIDMNLSVVVLGIATIVYTVLGGIRAVVWTDFIQFIVYMLGAGIAFWILLDKVDGGFGRITELANESDKLRVFDFGFDLTVNYQFWAGMIGGAVFAVGTHGVDQLMVQRYLCAKNERQAGVALALSGPLVLFQFAFFLLIGTALYAFYTQNPPDVAFERNDRVFATFIVDHMPIGILGLVLGAVFSAAMSTLSSSLNSTATALANDILVIESDEQKLRVVKFLTIAFGVAQIVVGIGSQWLDSSVISSVLAIQSFTTGIILGVFLLGIATKSLTARSALTGLLTGLVAMSVIKFTTPLAWPWFVLVGSAITFTAGLVADRLTRR